MNRWQKLKIFTLALALVLALSGVVFSINGVPVLIQSQNGMLIPKATLASAVASTDTAGKTIISLGYTPVDVDVTVPANRALKTWFGSSITVASGKTLTINGPYETGLYQSFYGAGSVTFGPGSVASLSPHSWGAKGDGTSNDHDAIQAAVNAAKTARIPVKLAVGSYKWTTPVLVYSGSQISGVSTTQYGDGFASTPGGTTILFQPTALGDAFQFVNSGEELLYHCSISNMFIKGNGPTNSRYGINVDGVIYGKFQNLSFSQGSFQSAIRTYRTIYNKFDNVFATGTVAAVTFSGGSSTTDVWTHCAFFGSPIGVNTTGNTIAIRFDNCNFEQLDYGANLVKETQSMEFVSCYSEDVPYADNANGAMFRLGYDGTALIIENNLIVQGGVYQGRNAGVRGSFLDADYCNGVMAGGFNVSRYTNVIKTSANTRDNSIVLTGYAGISWTNNITDLTKVTGMYPSGVVNSGSNRQILRAGDLSLTASVTTPGAIQGGLLISTGGIRATNIPIYADNAAAIAGGLVSGDVYKLNATAALTTVP